MSELRDNPDLMMEVIAKLVHRVGGYVRVTGGDEPIGPFNLLSRIDKTDGVVELRLEESGAQVGNA